MNSIPPAAHLDFTEIDSVASIASTSGDTAVLIELAAARQRVEQTLLHEIEAMVLFALGAGLNLPPEALIRRQHPASDAPPPHTGAAQLLHLAELHLSLTKLIAPARGATLVLLADERRRHLVLNAFGPVPQVRWMMATAGLSLVLLLGTALSGSVNPENVSKGLLNLRGAQLAVVELFLVAAAAVGATLANLKRLNRYVSDCTYDPRYDSSYWTRLVMGMISGVILSQMVFSSLVGGDSSSANNSVSSGLSGFGQPILAILGGFSADLVHDILTHLISVIGNTLGLGKAK